jgi:hypothetical protein
MGHRIYMRNKNRDIFSGLAETSKRRNGYLGMMEGRRSCGGDAGAPGTAGELP